MARANEQWLHFTEDTEVLCIFSGPHAYISPRWYASEFSVPTWNYAVVHVYGMPEIIEEPEALRKIVDDTTAKYEQRFDTPWSMHLPEKAVDGMLRAIVGFSIKITRIEAKFKLGQNKSVEDQEAMLLGLESDSDPASNELAQFMKDYKP
jgi:transcriptional regulator